VAHVRTAKDGQWVGPGAWRCSRRISKRGTDSGLRRFVASPHQTSRRRSCSVCGRDTEPSTVLVASPEWIAMACFPGSNVPPHHLWRVPSLQGRAGERRLVKAKRRPTGVLQTRVRCFLSRWSRESPEAGCPRRSSKNGEGHINARTPWDDFVPSIPAPRRVSFSGEGYPADTYRAGRLATPSPRTESRGGATTVGLAPPLRPDEPHGRAGPRTHLAQRFTASSLFATPVLAANPWAQAGFTNQIPLAERDEDSSKTGVRFRADRVLKPGVGVGKPSE